jgi:hypothetical protein
MKKLTNASSRIVSVVSATEKTALMKRLFKVTYLLCEYTRTRGMTIVHRVIVWLSQCTILHSGHLTLEDGTKTLTGNFEHQAPTDVEQHLRKTYTSPASLRKTDSQHT